MEQVIAQYFPHLRPAQQRGLTLWVYGTILAQSACQNAVIAALLVLGRWLSLRQYLREWLYNGADKAAPCKSEVNVRLCFAPLLQWLLSWWQGPQLALAIDTTLHGDRVAALVVSVLYRGSAIPIAWQILPANKKGPWIAPILQLLQLVAPVVPQHRRVLAVAMLWVIAYGTRGEDAAAQGLPPGRLRWPPQQAAVVGRKVSVFRQGISWLHRQLGRGRLWRRLWLLPEPWPVPPAGLQIIYGSS